MSAHMGLSWSTCAGILTKGGTKQPVFAIGASTLGPSNVPGLNNARGVCYRSLVIVVTWAASKHIKDMTEQITSKTCPCTGKECRTTL